MLLELVSQKWLSVDQVNDPIWWHWLTIIVPDKVETNKGLLLIAGGSRTSKQPTKANDILLKIAMATNSVVTNLHNVPNQPTVFKNDDYGPRVEDELIAFGWRQFLTEEQR